MLETFSHHLFIKFNLSLLRISIQSLYQIETHTHHLQQQCHPSRYYRYLLTPVWFSLYHLFLPDTFSMHWFTHLLFIFDRPCIESTIRAGILPVSFLLLLLHYQHLKWCLIYSDHLINISYWINLKLSSIISLVAPLKKSLKCKCFQKAIGLFLPPVSYFIILPLLNLSLFFLWFLNVM